MCAGRPLVNHMKVIPNLPLTTLNHHQLDMTLPVRPPSRETPQDTSHGPRCGLDGWHHTTVQGHVAMLTVDVAATPWGAHPHESPTTVHGSSGSSFALGARQV